jgi:hypothetical protein
VKVEREKVGLGSRVPSAVVLDPHGTAAVKGRRAHDHGNKIRI